MTTQQDQLAQGLSKVCWASMAKTQGRGPAGKAHRGVCGCSDACCEGWVWQAHSAQQLLNLFLGSALRICLHPPQHSLSPTNAVNMVSLLAPYMPTVLTDGVSLLIASLNTWLHQYDYQAKAACCGADLAPKPWLQMSWSRSTWQDHAKLTSRTGASEAVWRPVCSSSCSSTRSGSC